jgi:hypothetical protein
MLPESILGSDTGTADHGGKEMTKGNGTMFDEGLMAIKASFEGAQYLSTDAFDAASLIMLGTHRKQQIPDNVIMEVYGAITEGKNIQLKLDADSDGDVGFIANIESYADMVAFMKGTLEATPIGDHSRAN